MGMGNGNPILSFEIFRIVFQVVLEVVDRSLWHAILYTSDTIPILLFVLFISRRMAISFLYRLRL